MLAEEAVDLAPNIYLKQITLAYREKCLFSNLSLHLPKGQWVALIGASGVGKSSLLRVLAGLTTTSEKFSGHIFADNSIPVNQQIVYMPQNDLLLPWLTVLENTLLSTKLTQSLQHRPNMERAQNLLEKVGLADAIHLYPHQLSGGMRQRTALARTLMENKPIVLMDEPFSALDTITRYKLQNLAASLLKDKTVFFITHDPIEALRLAHVVYLLKDTPAKLCQIAQLDSQPPRHLSHPEVLKLQTLLFSELMPTEEANV